MAEDSKVDLVAQLPDEVLMEIFGHLPSLRDKLRLESVNTRFQRCLLELLRTRPIPLVYDYDAILGERLNGYRLQNLYFMPGLFLDGLQSLGTKAKFSSIDIEVHFASDVKLVLDWVLAALVSSDIDCLDRVTTFKVRSDGGCSETLLGALFAKCVKLSEVRLKLYEHSRPPPPLKLGVVLKDKALTHLQLCADMFSPYNTQEQAIQMFQSIKPNTLKKIDLRLRNTSALNMDVLVTELCDGGWSALEEIDIEWIYTVWIDTLFSSLTRLPKLRKCNFVLREMSQSGQLGPALTSLAAGLKFLFANHAEIMVDYEIHGNHNPIGCQLVALIRQVQSRHPDLEVGFGPYGGDILTLTLGKVSFKQQINLVVSCNNDECPECSIFYPTVLSRIASEAHRLARGGQSVQVHLANARLDRCRIDSVDVVDDLHGKRWKALEAEMNEDHNLATITFEPRYQRLGCGDVKFSITVDCGQCLAKACFACLYVG